MSPPGDRERPFLRSPLVWLLPHHTPGARVVFLVGMGILLVGVAMFVMNPTFHPKVFLTGETIVALLLMTIGLIVVKQALFGVGGPTPQ